MTVRDRSLIAALGVAFVVLSSLALAPALVPAGALASPGASVPQARAYVEGVLGHASNASPFGARSIADRELVALLFRGLVRLGPDNTVVGDLAERWEVDAKGKTWTFHLRDGLRWQDGEPITADDVVFTISALSDHDYDGPGAASWREVRVRALDPRTVQLTLATPLGGFLQAATQPIAPVHLLGHVPPADLANDPFGREPVGSGPFRLVALDERHAVLESADTAAEVPVVGESGAPDDGASVGGAFPRPYLDGIELEFYDDAEALRSDWDAGLLDGASGLAPADAAALAGQPGARLLRYPSSTILAIVLNLRVGHTRFSTPGIRKALLEAIDRDALVARSLDGFGSVATALIPEWAPEFDAHASPLVAYDPAAAKKDLEKAGWKQTRDGWIPKGAKEPLSVTLLSADADSNHTAYETAAAVAAAWRAIGLGVTHEAVPAAELVSERLGPGNFEAAVLPLVIGLDPDLYPLLASSQTRTGGANVSGLQDPDLDKLLAAARAPAAEDKRLAAYAALQERLASQLYILPLAFREDVVVVRSTLSGPAVRPLGGPGDRFWDVLTWRLVGSPTGG